MAGYVFPVPSVVKHADRGIQISAFDLRFPVQTPFMNFTGNFNSYTTRLVRYIQCLPLNSVNRRI